MLSCFSFFIYGDAIPVLLHFLICFPSYNKAEALLNLLHCCEILNLQSLLTDTLPCYIAVPPPNPKTVLTYYLSHYNANTLSILKYCWCLPCLITLLRCSQSRKIADVYLVILRCWAVCKFSFFWRISCFVTLLSRFPSYNYAEAHLNLLHCCENLICNHCWRIPFLVTLLSCSQLWKTADVFPLFLQNLAVSNP